ncbi:hypothetical protein ABZ883_37090 [Streptomyces sp. NPDC046977]|uniref:hypothetical protein n=1 Tax=Streptomyces sp. NPDC046977 TaxID=3154703 RepID=UPI0033D74082
MGAPVALYFLGRALWGVDDDQAVPAPGKDTAQPEFRETDESVPRTLRPGDTAAAHGIALRPRTASQ